VQVASASASDNDNDSTPAFIGIPTSTNQLPIMDLHSVLNPSSESVSSPTGTVKYALVQLPPQILKSLTNTDTSNSSSTLEKYAVSESGKFQLKAASQTSTPYLTTPTETFKLRVQNHSNCVLLLNTTSSSAIAHNAFSSYLILDPVTPAQLSTTSLDLSDFIVHDLHTIDNLRDLLLRETQDTQIVDITPRTLSQLHDTLSATKSILNQTPVSPTQLETLLIEQDIVAYGTSIVKVHTSLATSVLNSILTTLLDAIPSDTDINEISLTSPQVSSIIEDAVPRLQQRYDLPRGHITTRIVTQVFLKYLQYTSEDDNNGNDDIPTTDNADVYLHYTIPRGTYTPQHNRIIRFVTNSILQAAHTMVLDDLLIQIRLSLPANYLPSFEINEILAGVSYTTNATSSGQTIVHYLTLEQLQQNHPSTGAPSPAERFSTLFSLKNMWQVEEMQPFLTDVNVKGLKVDKFCLKYCRVKKMKNKVMLTKR
jgi:sister chromatid cohesion protein DCC1